MARRALRHLSGRFPGVTRLRPREPVPAWQPSRLNLAIQPALRLAELVLAGSSVDPRGGPVPANGLLLDLATLFEDFLAAALAAELTRSGGTLRRKPRGFRLDERGRIAIFPDLVWQRGATTTAVVDAKYKRAVKVEDAYQMLAYCTVTGLRHGHLVYMAGGRPVRHVVRNAGTEIVWHPVDLGLPPQRLLDRVREVAAAIRSRSLPPAGPESVAGSPGNSGTRGGPIS